MRSLVADAAALSLVLSVAFGIAACSLDEFDPAFANAPDAGGSVDAGSATPSGSSGRATSPTTAGDSNDAGSPTSSFDAGTAPTGNGGGSDAGLSTSTDVDSGGSADSGSTAPFTQSELQDFVNVKCASCHITETDGTMSLANDFTANTVGVPSKELPSMNRITAGSRDNSYLYLKIKGVHVAAGGSGERMPKGGPYLDDSDIERIGGFIDGL